MEEVSTIYEGKKYKSWNEFAIEYEQFLTNSYHPIFVLVSKGSAKAYNKLVKHKLPLECGYYRAEFGCALGLRPPSDSKGLRKRVSKKLNCTAKVKIIFSRHGYYEIKVCQLDHVYENGERVHDINEDLFNSYRTFPYLEKNYLIPRVVQVYSETERKMTWIVTRNKDLKEQCDDQTFLAEDSETDSDDEPKKKLPKTVAPSDSRSDSPVLPCSSQPSWDKDAVPTIYEGKKYKSWNEFAIEYEQFLTNSYHPIFVLVSKGSANGYNKLVKHKLPLECGYYRAEFGCALGLRPPSDSKGLRKRVSKKLNCTAKVKIIFSRHGYYEIKVCQLDHVYENGERVHDINEDLFNSYRTFPYLEQNYLIPRAVQVYSETERKMTWIVTRNKDVKEQCDDQTFLAEDSETDSDDEPKKKLPKTVAPSDSRSDSPVLPCSSQPSWDKEAVPTIYEGKKFKSWNEFAIEYEQFLEQYHHPIFVLTSKNNARSYNSLVKNKLPLECGFFRAEFSCVLNKMNCTAKVKIVYSRFCKYFDIKTCQLDHVDENGVKVHDLTEEVFNRCRRFPYQDNNYLIPRVVQVYIETEKRLTWITTRSKDLKEVCIDQMCRAEYSDTDSDDEPKQKLPRKVPSDSGSESVLPCSSQPPALACWDKETVPTIYEGKKYKCWNEFAIEYEQFLEQNLHPIFIFGSKNTVKNYNLLVKDKLPLECGYQRAEFSCARSNCTAKVKIIYSRINKYFEIKSCQLDHVDESGVNVHDLNIKHFYRRRKFPYLNNHLIPRVVQVYSETEKQLTWITTRSKDVTNEVSTSSFTDLTAGSHDDFSDDEANDMQEENDDEDEIENEINSIGKQNLPIINIVTDKTGQKLMNVTMPPSPKKVVIINETGLQQSDLSKILPKNVSIEPGHGSEVREVFEHDENMKETNVSKTNKCDSLESPRLSGQMNNAISTVTQKISHKHFKILRKPYSVDVESLKKQRRPIYIIKKGPGAQIKDLKLDIDSSTKNRDIGTTRIVQLETDSSDDESSIEQLEQDCVELTDPLKFEVADEPANPMVIVSEGQGTFMFAENTDNHIFPEKPATFMVIKEPSTQKIAEKTANPTVAAKTANPTVAVKTANPTVAAKPATNTIAKKPASPIVATKPANPMFHEKPTNSKVADKSSANTKTAGKLAISGFSAKKSTIEKSVKSAKKTVLCRGCLSSQPPLEPLVGDLAKLYRQFIDNDIIDSSIGDVYPKFLCKACSATLLQFTAFREKCLWMQKYFIKNHVVNTKMTPQSSEDTSAPMLDKTVKGVKPPKELNSPNVLKYKDKQNCTPNIRGKPLEDIRVSDSKGIRVKSQEMRVKPPEKTRVTSEEIHAASEEIHASSEEIHEASEKIHVKLEEIHGASEEIHEASEYIHVKLEEIHGASEEIHVASEEIHAASEETHTASEEIHEASKEIHEASKEIHVKSEEILPASEETHVAPKEIYVTPEEIQVASEEIHMASEEIHEKICDITSHEIREKSPTNLRCVKVPLSSKDIPVTSEEQDVSLSEELNLPIDVVTCKMQKENPKLFTALNICGKRLEEIPVRSSEVERLKSTENMCVEVESPEDIRLHPEESVISYEDLPGGSQNDTKSVSDAEINISTDSIEDGSLSKYSMIVGDLDDANTSSIVDTWARPSNTDDYD